MNLLVDCHVFDGKFQGTRTYIEGVYRNMLKHGEIEFFFAAQDIDNLKSCFGKASNAHYITLKTGNSIKRLSMDFPKIIKDYKIDYAHFQYISPLVKSCKEIITMHDLLFLDYPEYFPLTYRLKNKWLFRRSAQRADLLLTVSPFSRDEITRHFGIPSSKIHLTPNGIALPPVGTIFPDVKKKYGLDKFVMSVSRIEPRKNHQMLLKVYSELKLSGRGYKLVLVGAKDLANKEFNRLYDSLPEREKKMIMIVQVPYLELMALYKSADLFVFPSFAEGFGIPPLEAAAMGCPVLCSNQTAMADFDFFDECLFSPFDLEELKTKIEAMLSGKLPMVKNIRKICLEKYDWAITAEKLYRLIRI